MHSFPMKSVMSLLFLVGSLGVTLAGKDATTTDPTPRIKLIQTDDSRKINLVYQSATVQPVSIRVVDAEGNTLYKTRMVNEVNFMQTLSFEEVPMGTYYVEVRTEEVSFREAVRIDGSPVALQAHVSPYAERGKFLLSVPGETSVNVEIFDYSENLLFSGEVNLEETSGSKLFDLSQVWGNTALFVVSNEVGVVYQSISLR